MLSTNGPLCDHGHAQIEFSQHLRKSLLNAPDNDVSPQLSQLARVCFGEDIRFGVLSVGNGVYIAVSSQGSNCFYYPLSTLQALKKVVQDLGVKYSMPPNPAV